MLIQFRTENHRSLRDEQTLSLVASSQEPDDPRLIQAEAIGERLLPVVALYGANASGKSNVFHALGFMKEAVEQSHREWAPGDKIPREPFILGPKRTEVSLYEVDVLVGGIRHRYGFT